MLGAMRILFLFLTALFSAETAAFRSSTTPLVVLSKRSGPLSGANFLDDCSPHSTKGLPRTTQRSMDIRSSQLQMTDTNDDDSSWLASESDQVLLGSAGTIASLATFYSEFTLKSTGCGLPAGPFGLFGAVEGISYLGVAGFAGFSLFKKVKTGSGLPAGPGGLLGLAEGLSFLAILVGFIVLAFQILDYGYIPNAVPMEGGMCG